MDTVEDTARQLTHRLTAIGVAGLVGGLAARRFGDPATAAFGTQSALWGAIDLAIAGVASARSAQPRDAAQLRRVLLVNAGLDVGYVAAGVVVARLRPTVGGRVTQVESRGHGLAVVVQGAALLALDLVHARRLSP